MQDGTPYDVTVTVLKPEVNDLEGLKQCYAYQTRRFNILKAEMYFSANFNLKQNKV